MERFEAPERVLWQKPAEVIAVLGVRRGARIVDIGAGTGYFSVPLARATGPRGVVYAAEVDPGLVDHLEQRAAGERVPALEPWPCRGGALELPEKVDLAFVCNTYHHLEDRPLYLRRLFRLLQADGRVAILDWHKRALPIGPSRETKLARADVVAELRASGFSLAERFTFLPYQYFLVFSA